MDPVGSGVSQKVAGFRLWGVWGSTRGVRLARPALPTHCGWKRPVGGDKRPRRSGDLAIHLRRIHTEGYKALDPVDLRLPEKLLFLIGSNGSGKSSTLQALAFVQFFATGRCKDFFLERHWNRLDVRSRTVERPHNTLRYNLLFDCDDGSRVLWQFIWGLNSEALIQEKMWLSRSDSNPIVLYTFDRRTGLNLQSGEDIKGLMPPGSILTVITPSAVTAEHEIATSVLNWCERITSLELLSPVAMRSNVRGSPKGIGARGQRLAGFLAALDSKTKARIVDRLSDFYPLENLSTTRKKAGWIDLRISESFSGIGAIPAQHVSDGFLRLLALCAIPEFGSRSSMVLLDEIEDGIEPHVLPRLIERVVEDSSAQFVMTSHSPLLINFFDPSGVILLTRTPDGRANFTQLSNLKSVRDGLEFFGPGEIWANTGLDTLNTQAVKEHGGSATNGRRTADNMLSTQWAYEFMGVPG